MEASKLLAIALKHNKFVFINLDNKYKNMTEAQNYFEVMLSLALGKFYAKISLEMSAEYDV